VQTPPILRANMQKNVTLGMTMKQVKDKAWENVVIMEINKQQR
jgi:hypothetical protein